MNASPEVLQPALLRTPLALLAMTSGSCDFLAILISGVGSVGPLQRVGERTLPQERTWSTFLTAAAAAPRPVGSDHPPFSISVYRRCISLGVTSSMWCPMIHSWPKGSRTVPERSP